MLRSTTKEATAELRAGALAKVTLPIRAFTLAPLMAASGKPLPQAVLAKVRPASFTKFDVPMVGLEALTLPALPVRTTFLAVFKFWVVVVGCWYGVVVQFPFCQ